MNYMCYWVAKNNNSNPLLMSNVKSRKKKRSIESTVYIHMGCPLTREGKQKKNQIFHFQKCPRPLARDCLLTTMCKCRV